MFSRSSKKSDRRSSGKIGLFHDYFAIRGGGERLVLTLARHLPGAALLHGFRTDDSYDASAFPQAVTSLNLPSFLQRAELRVFALAMLFAFWRKRARAFPIRIFSGVSAPFAAPKSGDGSINIFYCHTPPRFLYDQRALFLSRQGPVRRIAVRAVMACFEAGYKRAVARMDVIVTNSGNTQERIRHYLGRESVVVHPPVDTDRFSWRGQGDYYLSTARLTPLKRVESIVEAFLSMPDKKLVVASGGEDLEHLKSRAANAPNIEFRGWVSDEELLDLVGHAIATIYLPMDEDFGMSPVESMAAGKPVIAVAEGGLLETVKPEETGMLLKKDFSVNDIVVAVRAMTPDKAGVMRDACEARAQDFTRDRFISGMRAVIEQASAAAFRKP